MNSMKKSFPVKSLIQVSMLIALALVIRNFSYMVYFGGAPGMRIGFSGVFTKIASILFGPVLGGAASGIVDFLGYVIKPEGAYIPLLTITSILGGVLIGFMWKLTGDVVSLKFKRFFLVLILFFGVFGVANQIILSYFTNFFWANILHMLGKYTPFTTVGLELVSCAGLLFYAVDILLKKLHGTAINHSSYLKVVIITGISGILVTTLNTCILQMFIPALGRMGFIMLWIPRVIEEILMTLIHAYIISLLLAIYKKNFPAD